MNRIASVPICLLITIPLFFACTDSKNQKDREDLQNLVEDSLITDTVEKKKLPGNENNLKNGNLKELDSDLRVSKDSVNNQNRLKLIRKIIKEYGFLELPYRYYYNSDSVGGISDEIDRESFLNLGINFTDFIGVLPDTTENFYYVESKAASVLYLYVSHINKKGERVYYKGNSLFACNCLHYVEDDIYCTEYITITDSLKLEYYYKTKYVYDVMDENDTICEFKLGHGYINTSNYGQVVYDSIIERSCLNE